MASWRGRRGRRRPDRRAARRRRGAHRQDRGQAEADQARERVAAFALLAGRRAAARSRLDANGRVVQQVQPRAPAPAVASSRSASSRMAVRKRQSAGRAARPAPDAPPPRPTATKASAPTAASPCRRSSATAIWQKVMGEDSLLSRCDQLVTGSNNMTDAGRRDHAVGHEQRHPGLLGLRGAAVTTLARRCSSRRRMRLNKLTALVPVTDELLEDAPWLDSYLRPRRPQKMQSKLNTAIIRGTGVGQPLGILNSAAWSRSPRSPARRPPTPSSPTSSRCGRGCTRPAAATRCGSSIRMRAAAERDGVRCQRRPAKIAGLPAGRRPVGSPYATLMGRPVVPCRGLQHAGRSRRHHPGRLQPVHDPDEGPGHQDRRLDAPLLRPGPHRLPLRVPRRRAAVVGHAITPEFGSNTRSWAVTLEAR
jgi:hypothetical protein